MEATEKERARALELLRGFTEAHGAPGYEDEVRELFVGELRAIGGLSADRLGGVACRLPSEHAAPRVLFASHFDEVGFMVQSITPDGFLKFLTLGGWNPQAVLAQRVTVRNGDGRKIPGVITSLPPHFAGAADQGAMVPVETMFIDIGARNLREAEEVFGVRLGDPVVPDSAFTKLSRHRLMAKAFDNRVGVALAVQAAQALAAADRALPGEVIFAGTVQEEVGTRGAVALGHLVNPDVAIVLEGPPADDTPGMSGPESQGILGGGVRVYDPSAIMSRRLVDRVTALADDQDIPYQVTVRRGGGTDAKALSLTRNGVPCVVIGVPARYIHSPSAIIDPDDYLAALALVKALAYDLDENAVGGLTDFV